MVKNELQITIPHTSIPIVILGAGGIVNDAHLPAYHIAGFEVAGIYDIDLPKAEATAKKYGIRTVYESLEQAITQSPTPVIYDLALPGSQIIPVLKQIPDNSFVLLQKPMGNHWQQAKDILAITRTKKMVAGVNFQLRYAPFISKARQLIEDGLIGEICDIDININVYTPWHLWPFLAEVPFMELYYHSIHYVDLVRSFLGNPTGIWAQSKGHPLFPHLGQVRSNILMNYGENQRVSIATNHQHNYHASHQHAWIKIEGTVGAIRMVPGVLMDYPNGRPDTFEYISLHAGKPCWETVPMQGSWFPHAFAGSMAQMMLAMEGTHNQPDNSVEDALFTMACIEAACESCNSGATSIPKLS